MSIVNVQSGVYADSPTGGFPGTLESSSEYLASVVKSFTVLPIAGQTTEDGLPCGFAAQFADSNSFETPGGPIKIATVTSTNTDAYVGIAVRGYLPTNNVNYGTDASRQVAGYPDNSVASIITFGSNAVIYVEIPVGEVAQYRGPVYVATASVNDSGIPRGAISTGDFGLTGLTLIPGAFIIDTLGAITDNRVVRIRLA